MTGWQIVVTVVGGWLFILFVGVFVLGLCAAAARPYPKPAGVVCAESPVVPSSATSGIGSAISCEREQP